MQNFGAAACAAGAVAKEALCFSWHVVCPRPSCKSRRRGIVDSSELIQTPISVSGRQVIKASRYTKLFYEPNGIKRGYRGPNGHQMQLTLVRLLSAWVRCVHQTPTGPQPQNPYLKPAHIKDILGPGVSG